MSETQSADFFIGKSDFTGRTFSPRKWHKMEAGENLFRILPPVHSMARLRKWAVFHSTHGGFKSKTNKVFKFHCIEQTEKAGDGKTRIIKTHCPVCDMVNEAKKQYELLKTNPKVTQDQLRAFHEAKIRWYQAEKRFYLNAIDAAGEIGILQISYKTFMQLESLFQKQVARGFDPTDREGAFVLFTKNQRFKGDPQTTYSVVLAQEQNGDDFKLKRHTLTNEIIEQMKTATADLGKLYRDVPAEQISALVSASPTEQAELVERLFGKSADANDQAEEASDDVLVPIQGTGQQDMLGRTIPGTSATAVYVPELTAEGFKVAGPSMPAVAPAVEQQVLQPVQPSSLKVAPPVVNLSIPAPTADTSALNPPGSMSDDAFKKMFGIT